MSENWSSEELKAAVIAYIDMRKQEAEGLTYSKAAYYRDLASRFARSEKSFGYRMHNISYVYSLMGRDWLPGLKPAKHVGSNVAAELEAIINEVEKQYSSVDVVFEAKVNSLSQLKKLERPKGNAEPDKSTQSITQFVRDPNVVAWVLRNSKGRCECCDNEAPFTKDDGMPFLEVHHLKRLADGGADTIFNAVAVCPNCHRELHFGQNRQDLLIKVSKKIDRITNC